MDNGHDEDSQTRRPPLSSETRGLAAPPPAPSPTPDTAGRRSKDATPRIALAVVVAVLTASLALHVRWLFSKRSLSDAVSDASTWLKAMAGGGWSANSFVFGPYLVLLVLVAGLLVHYGMPRVWQSVRRSLQLGAVLGACLAGVWFIGTTRLTGLKVADWLFFVPIVPPTLLAFQAMITWRQRPRSVGDFRVGVSKELRCALEQSGDVARFEEIHAQLLRVFGGIPGTGLRGRTLVNGPAVGASATQLGSSTPTSFATQFAVPGLLLLIVGFGVIALATNDHAVANNALGPNTGVGVRLALKWGAAGAYTYVLFTFGARMFRNDLTVGAATWAIITLITGPTLAVVLALGWNITADSHAGWQSAIVLFFAGLAPSQVMNIIESAALKLLKPSSDDNTSKLTPLTTLRGVSPALGLRLREENIEDVTGLAYADPIRLIQALPYDLRQVVEWIDQAHLAVALPEQHEKLLQRGVTGAIDLAWRWLQACIDPATGEITIAHAKTTPQSFKMLVGGADDEAELVYETARQMFYEEQVRLLWVMYNCFSTTAGGDPGNSDTRDDDRDGKGQAGQDDDEQNDQREAA
jgi:hypothetical protein